MRIRLYKSLLRSAPCLCFVESFFENGRPRGLSDGTGLPHRRRRSRFARPAEGGRLPRPHSDEHVLRGPRPPAHRARDGGQISHGHRGLGNRQADGDGDARALGALRRPGRRAPGALQGLPRRARLGLHIERHGARPGLRGAGFHLYGECRNNRRASAPLPRSAAAPSPPPTPPPALVPPSLLTPLRPPAPSPSLPAPRSSFRRSPLPTLRPPPCSIACRTRSASVGSS